MRDCYLTTQVLLNFSRALVLTLDSWSGIHLKIPAVVLQTVRPEISSHVSERRFLCRCLWTPLDFCWNSLDGVQFASCMMSFCHEVLQDLFHIWFTDKCKEILFNKWIKHFTSCHRFASFSKETLQNDARPQKTFLSPGWRLHGTMNVKRFQISRHGWTAFYKTVDCLTSVSMNK